ncbi:hypothetical protein ABE61_12035 [Lysinibacillus sphaericus]|nr:hypothetical protein [Lysinibacillus sphaericus]MBG9478188.1 hypothetical protein [Lysinibacillus sphaericus]MBG9590901.1 hypothetical protein [Lysinibacillus sphaericus]
MGDSSGIRGVGTKAKSIATCDNAFVTNIVLLLSHKQNQNPMLPLRYTHAFAQKTSVGPRPCSEADGFCAKA